MNGNIFLYSLCLLLLVVATSIIFKRSFKINYDRKALLSALMAFIMATIGYFIYEVRFPIADLGYAQKVIATAAFVLFANAIIQFIFWFVFAAIKKKNWVKIPRFVFDIFSFFIILGVLLYSIKFIFNQELTGLLVTSTVVSAVIGLALQDTLSNLFSGISLQIESPFNIDEWVNLGGFEGKVVSQNWRTVTILTRENHRVSLTNRFVAEDKIVNFSRPTRRQIHNFYIELDYSHPPNFVKKVLRDLLNEIYEVDLDTNHGAFVLDYNESGIKYCLRYWLHDYADILQIQDVVLSRLWYTLRRHNIKIPYPTSEVQMQVIPGPEESNPEIIENKIIEFLSNLDWLKEMPDGKIEKLAKECKLEIYGSDDLIVKQGDEGDSMFIVFEGGVRVLLRSEANNDIEIAQKNSGEFFGEMSLLSGEPRTASVRAYNDCKVLVIDKKSFSTLVISDDKILAEFVQVLVKSKSGIADAILSEQQNSNVTKESAHTIIINRIWSYLNAT